MASDMALRGLDDFTRSKFRIQAQPWFATEKAEDRTAYLGELQARHDAYLADLAAKAAADKARRDEMAAAQKALKEERTKEKKAQDELKKEEKRIAKEKADVAKEEKRVQAMEDRIAKQARQKDEAIAKAKRQAEMEAEKAVERARKNAEKAENTRRQILERKAKEEAQRDIALARQKAFEERQKELSSVTEARIKAEADLQLKVRQAAEARVAQERRDRDDVEANLRKLRSEAFRAPVDPPRSSAAHPLPTPLPLSSKPSLRSHYTALGSAAPKSPGSVREDELMANAIHSRLAELLQQSKVDIKKRQSASLAEAQGISPMLPLVRSPSLPRNAHRFDNSPLVYPEI